MNPVFLILCLIMFGVFYQKGLKFFQSLGHSKWRSHLEGAAIGLLIGFGFPLAVVLSGAEKRKPDAPEAAVENVKIPGPASGESGSAAKPALKSMFTNPRY